MPGFYHCIAPHGPSPTRHVRTKALRAIASRLTGKAERGNLTIARRETTPEPFEELSDPDFLLQTTGALRLQLGGSHTTALRSTSVISNGSTPLYTELPELSFDSCPSTPSTSGLPTPNASRLSLPIYAEGEDEVRVTGYYKNRKSHLQRAHASVHFPTKSPFRPRPCRSKASVLRDRLIHPSSASVETSSPIDIDAVLASLAPLPPFNPYFRLRAVSMSSVIRNGQTDGLRTNGTRARCKSLSTITSERPGRH
ncbi:hypothetical protein BXZ70DRAFT_288042 [Cristinia sonorae]|uniref:Uncharacterized protein n=1 Tax=Cristinia sonorae TaxID=1940300 RepID=A0A8K0XNU2_9AGAR|nr:hypothetical protein BXZ70DRAFT_288042 [Cristinia sonorae]